MRITLFAFAFATAFATELTVGCGMTDSDDPEWTCDVRLNMDGEIATGTGTGATLEAARSAALQKACPNLGLKDNALRSCLQGENPGARSWGVRWDCKGSI